MRPAWGEPLILYFGNWHEEERRLARGGSQAGAHRCNTQFHAFECCFRGAFVRWIGTQGPDHGFADVYFDGEFQGTVDNYAASLKENVVKFTKSSIEGDQIHTLRVVVRKERNPKATDCYQDITAIEAPNPVSYPAEIAHAMHKELARIRTGAKSYSKPDEWSPFSLGSQAPAHGVTLRSGLLKDLLERNVDYIKHSFASPTYVDEVGWSEWLPASIEGRLLAGAGNTLRWGEREDMRTIVNTIVDDVEKRMREDGYYNYYPEASSYTLNYGNNSERKNYDRVFWTRGMIAAGLAGNPKAFTLLRRMYDWFNASPYLPDMLFGGNATNGMPGGPLTYLSPAGTNQDLVVSLRYYDQEYWRRELAARQPLALSHYPGERPHCYDLLGLEMFIDIYRATGERKYLEAVLGGWDIYRDNYKHIGGATAIMESHEAYPPKSYYFENKAMGETCGSVFWIFVNSKLMHFFPAQECFAAEIEEAIYNVIAAAQDNRGYIRYQNKLHGRKTDAECAGTCCEVAAAGLIASFPELIYSVAENTIYIHLYASSEITLRNGVRLAMTTEFPFENSVLMRVSTPSPRHLDLRIRVPSWATDPVVFMINGKERTTGKPGSYQSIARTWSNGDTVTFTLPAGFNLIQYIGLDQRPDNVDRYALLYGPILMALKGDWKNVLEDSPMNVDPTALLTLLNPVGGVPLTYEVNHLPGYRYVPYWTINDEPFTCFPAIQADT